MLPSDKNIAKGYLALTATSVIWGTTWVANKFAVQQVPGLQLSFMRQFIAGTLFLLYFLLRKQKLPTLPQFRWLVMLSLFMFVFANGLSTWSVKFVSSGLGALIGALYPLCVVIIEMLFLKKNSNTPLTFIGLIIGIAGVLFVFYENAFHQQPPGYGFGIAIGLIAMLSWSIGTIFVARNKYDVDPYYALGWQMFFGSFFTYGFSRVIGIEPVPFHLVPKETWLALLYLICMGSLVAFVAFVYTVRNLPPALASIYAYINPLVAMLAGAWLLSEPLTFNLVIGAFITLTGVYLVNYSLKKKAA
ncbi:DMT family transporter [Foetidibacter luteolus]|uniref:DMT family transporter n=1 Tax=Foetidibacter luteolus TaxID=2608880 RepID=UPI00129A4850|nr:EamA family transporter [Foetidibacter luteolus]